MSDITKVINAEDLLAYMSIDYVDDMINKNIKRAINTADGELRESVSDDYPIDHPLTKELALMFAERAYDNRAFSTNEEKLAEQIALKLRLVLARGSNE